MREFRFIKRVCRRAALRMAVLFIAMAEANAQGALKNPGDDRPKITGPLSLKDAVEIAIHGSLSVQIAQTEAEAAREETRAVRAMSRPQLSTTTFLTTGTMPGILSTAPGVAPANILAIPGQSAVDQNLMLMVPLYTGGALGNLVKAASQRGTAAQAEVGGAQLDAVYAVRESYYRALLAVEFIKVAEVRVDAARTMVDVTRAQFEAGRGIQASVARVEAELADAQRMLTGARNEHSKTLLDLKRAMSVRWDSEITLTDALAIANLPNDLDSNLLEAARVRPELIAARARLDAARAQSAAARGARKPQVYGIAMGDAFAPGAGTRHVGGTIGVVMSIPLMDAGQRAAEARRAEAMERRSEIELQDLEQRVATEIRQARLDADTAAENYRAAVAVRESSEAAYEVMAVRVENQKSILVEQLDALATLTEARANLARALFDHALAVARLERAIGRN